MKIKKETIHMQVRKTERTSCMKLNLDQTFSGHATFPVKLVFITSIFLSVFFMATFNAYAVDVTVNTDIMPTPCNVTLSGGTDGQGNIVFPDNITSTQLGNKKIAPAPSVINLKMSGCSAAYSPKITVMTTFVGASADSSYLINANNGDVTKAGGVGFVMNFGFNTMAWANNGNGQSINIRTSCLSITTTPNSCKAQIPAQWLNVDIPIAVGISTGSSSTYRSGPLSATVTFTFAYQ